MKIAFIGGGNMGEAMLSAVLKSLPAPHSISISDISDTRLLTIEQKYSSKFSQTTFSTTKDNREAAEGSEIIVLAVKPQNLAEVMAGLKGSFKSSQVVLSIVAGANIETLRLGLNHQCIVRSMPNTPAQIGEGITVWTATAKVIEVQRSVVSSILGAMGEEVYVDDEKYLDMATAVSGSGPAYFFLFAESLIEAGVSIGLSQDVTEKLVLNTMLGSAHLMKQSDKTPAELRRMVTSPGGTTAEALAQLEKGEFTRIVIQAVTAAYEKAKELGK